MDDEFDIEMHFEGSSEDHEYAMDLINNLIEVSGKELDTRILIEVMMVYSLTWNMAHDDLELMSELLPQVISRIEDGSYKEAVQFFREEEMICH